MVDILVRVYLGQVWQCPIRHNSFSALAYIDEVFIIVVDPIAECVSDLLNGVVIVHGETV